VGLAVHRPNWELSILVETRDAPLPILDRVSGLPLGLPAELWPACNSCGTPLTFIGQFACDPARIEGPSRNAVLYAFLCANPKTLSDCHRSQLAPGQQEIGRVVMAEPRELSFTEPPSGLPAALRLGLVARGWTDGEDKSERESPPEDWDYLDEDAKAAVRRRNFLDHATCIGGYPVWLQEPSFQNDRERPERYRHRAEWCHSVPVRTRLHDVDWFKAEVERARSQRAPHLDVRRRIGGWDLQIRAFAAQPGYALINGTIVRRDADGMSTVSTSLASGTLYLISDTVTGAFELYYIGR
jgi:hypothetical protein